MSAFEEESAGYGGSKKVVIIGAGVSALATARELVDGGIVKGEDVLLLEAQNYIGGRIFQDDGQFIPGVKIDLGAEIVHGAHTVLHKYAEKCGETLKPLFTWAHGDGGPSEVPVRGGYALYFDGVTDPAVGRVYRYDEQSEEVVAMHETLWNLGLLEDDEVTPDQCLDDYLGRAEMGAPMRAMVQAGYSNTMCTTSENMSLQHIVKCTRLWNEDEEGGGEGKGSDTGGGVGGGADDDRPEGDYKPRNSFHWLVDHLKEGLDVRLNTTVVRVELVDGSKGVAVHTADGEVVRCEAAVVTVPAPVINAGTISFVPPLPAPKVAAYANLDFNNALKIILAFKECPWPTNVHGMIMTGCEVPEVWFTDVEGLALDPTDGTAKAVCYCTGFATAAFADALLTKHSVEDLPNVLLAQLTRVMGALTPEHMDADIFHPANHAKRHHLPKVEDAYLRGMVHDWRGQHPTVGGGYAVMRAGMDMTTFGALAEPIDDRIFFAGEGTALPGLTAHAAIETGSRVAAQVAVGIGAWPRC
jgi:monoamine oxidase